MHVIDDNRNIRTAEDEWESAIDFADGSNTHRLIEALLSTYDNVDDDLVDVYDQTHIDSATGRELDQFGELVNVERKYNEGDEKYRARIKAAFRASTMGATFDQFVEFCANTLDTNIANLNFNTPYESEPATVTVGANSSVYDSVGLTAGEIVELFGKGVPAGHKVNVIEGGTFRLKEDGDTDDATKGLTSDSITAGGTLAADVI